MSFCNNCDMAIKLDTENYKLEQRLQDDIEADSVNLRLGSHGDLNLKTQSRSHGDRDKGRLMASHSYNIISISRTSGINLTSPAMPNKARITPKTEHNMYWQN
ncbi:hypothetical protein N665_0308s0034 [Sinapis alba]|nr:hypothetical protein N665_0308s0034 [Sinapis alba]